jgi:hypothetical protein
VFDETARREIVAVPLPEGGGVESFDMTRHFKSTRRDSHTLLRSISRSTAAACSKSTPASGASLASLTAAAPS